ncbi:MAG: GNAT family N-acetyltransferase, partial [Oscillospiraceae bacterium]
METTIIDKGNIRYFEKMLLPEVTQMLLDGKAIFALGAVEDGTACGALAGGPREGRFYIRSFFVPQDSRKRGVGTVLLEELVRIAALQEELHELRCEFTISCEDHRLLADFLKKRGFAFEQPENAIVSVPLASLAKLSYYKETEPVCRVYRLSELPDSALRMLDRRLIAEAGPLFERSIDKMPLDLDCSTATMKNNEIDACLLLQKRGDSRLELSYANAGTSEDAGVFSSLLITAYRSAIKKYPQNTVVQIQPVTPLSAALVSRLAPDAQSLSRCALLP